jgi:pyridoxal phosphate enzyme (YggS family)
LAVSKTHPWSAVAQAANAGQRAFGENYVQEAVDKIAQWRLEVAGAAAPADLQWHLIGPLQSNKTREVAEHFDWVHSVDRLKIAQRLSDQRPAGLPPLRICLQVNISGEVSKSGLMPSDVLGLARAVNALPRLELRGLMTIPEPVEDDDARRTPHRLLRLLRDELLMADPSLHLPVLSMGMSDDLEAAIAEGATLVRVGTAIFGKRSVHHAQP